MCHISRNLVMKTASCELFNPEDAQCVVSPTWMTVGVKSCLNIPENNRLNAIDKHIENVDQLLSHTNSPDDCPLNLKTNELKIFNDDFIYTTSCQIPSKFIANVETNIEKDINTINDINSSAFSKNALRASTSNVMIYSQTSVNNRNHRKAVKKNFSLWIGVTSCVWGILLYLLKNYTSD